MSTNIHTTWIQNTLGVTKDVALKVQDEINTYYNFDWSEATKKEIDFICHEAFESLNVTHKF